MVEPRACYAKVHKLGSGCSNGNAKADCRLGSVGSIYEAVRTSGRCPDNGCRQSACVPPVFFSALLPEDKGLLTVQSRTGLLSRCGALFTSEIRVAVYGDLLFGGMKLTPIDFTPAVFVETLARLSNVGIRHFVLDRCPRCWSFEVCSNVSISGTESAVAHWALIKAAEMTRANYYLQLARHHSGAGAYAESRDIALYAVAHVAPDDTRFHEHLLTVAEQLADKVLQLEAKAAVRCISSPAWIAAISQEMELQITGSVLRI